MKEIYRIPQKFWSLFKSQNRYIYIESLLLIYDEYLYNDYFLTKDTCIQLISDYFSNRIIDISVDEEEEDMDNLEPMASKILSRLIRFTWLKKVEDYSSFTTNIIISEYASVFIEIFKKLDNPEYDDTDIYIQNIYANIYSFYHDDKAGIELLKTALVNTTKLNRVLQDMLHNMDKFFGSLLDQENYEELLQEHLTVYVETMVNKKYGLLKTNDNFYIYKNDIRKLLRCIQEDEQRLYLLQNKMMVEGKKQEDVEYEIMEIIDGVEHGMINIEKRISHIDTEHSKYIRATVSRLEYLLSNDDNMKGNVIKLLNVLGGDKKEELLTRISESMQLNDFSIITQESFYKKRGRRKVFEETVEIEELAVDELTKEDILRINRNKNRYNKGQIEHFILDQMENGIYKTEDHPIASAEEFELLVLAYDYSIRKNSPFQVIPGEKEIMENGMYRYPKMTFIKKGNTPVDEREGGYND